MNVTDGRQLKAARIILGLTIREVATLTNLNRNSILRVEAQRTLPRSAHAADRIEQMFEAKGIVFTVHNGLVSVSFHASQKRGSTPYKKKSSFA